MCATGAGCDLLPNVYLCNIINNGIASKDLQSRVVICFQMYIFAIS